MAQATKTRFDKEGVVYVQLRDTWFRIEGEEGQPVAEDFDATTLLTAEQLQAHIKTQAADLSAESPKQRPPFAIGQVWRMADGQEMTVVAFWEDQNIFRFVSGEDGEWLHPNGLAHSQEGMGIIAVEYLRETDRPRLEVGKKYRTAGGKIVTIVEDDGDHSYPFHDESGNWYHQFGFACGGDTDDEIVALVEDEPAQAAESTKNNPPLAVGQVWRMRNGEETLIHREFASGLFHSTTFDGRVNSFGGEGQVDPVGEQGPFDLMEYLRETDLVRIEAGRDYLRSDGKKAKVVKDIGNGWRFIDNHKTEYHQFSHCNNVTIDKDLPTAGDEVSYLCQDSDKWLSGWIVRGTNEDGTKTFLIPKDAKEGDYTRFAVATEHVRIDVRSTLPPIRIGDRWRRRDGELLAINFACNIDMTESHYPGGDLVCRVGKAMAAAGEMVAQFVHYKDALAFVKQNTTEERRLILASQANRHECPEMGKWFVHKILYVNAPAIEIE